eukprot:TRINITY_DN34573_c0_g1_i1.p2 TRINITY_DN34573_c0_g1~~TRINITY_DN34573_c0_g1_i1.p2  ORF type:complete len:112 (-),score=9.07 TRINITY_DN34573_c0_g1_i1:352-687(-)
MLRLPFYITVIGQPCASSHWSLLYPEADLEGTTPICKAITKTGQHRYRLLEAWEDLRDDRHIDGSDGPTWADLDMEKPFLPLRASYDPPFWLLTFCKVPNMIVTNSSALWS